MSRLSRIFAAIVITLAALIAQGTAADSVAVDLQGKVVFMRHAYAPGNGDPAHFKLGNCSTQRNLNDEGREQARLTGKKLRERNIVFSQVYSSEWCRCRETAAILDMGEAIPFVGLNSFYEHYFSEAELIPLLQEKLQAVEPTDGPILMVTHFVTIAAVTGKAVSSGDLVIYDPATGSAEMFKP